MSQTPSVGRDVHYISYGTPGGEYEPVCRAAKITEVHGPDASGDVVSLCVFNPEGLFFNKRVPQGDIGGSGGTWHWPERVPAVPNA